MIQPGSRKFTALMVVLATSLLVALVLAGVTIWGEPEAVAAAVGPIALMWGGVASLVGATFNGANAAEHLAASKKAASGPRPPEGV